MNGTRNNHNWPNNGMTASPLGNGTIGTVLERMGNRPECWPNRERIKDELVESFSSDRNAPFLPGYRPSPSGNPRNPSLPPPYPNHNLIAAGKRSGFDQLSHSSPTISRAQTAIGKTQFEIGRAQNMNVGNHAGARGNGTIWPTMGTPLARDEVSEQRAKKESYRRDLERQIEQSNQRKSDERRKDRETFNHPLGPQYAAPIPEPYNHPPVAPRLKRSPNPQTLCSHEQPPKNSPEREEALISPTVNPHSSMNPRVGQSQVKKRVSPCSPSLMKPPMNNKGPEPPFIKLGHNLSTCLCPPALPYHPQKGQGTEGVEHEYHPPMHPHHQTPQQQLQALGYRGYQGVPEIPSPWDQNGQWEEMETNHTWNQQPQEPERLWNQAPGQYQIQPLQQQQYLVLPPIHQRQPQQLPQQHPQHLSQSVEPAYQQPMLPNHPGQWGQYQMAIQSQDYLAPLDPSMKIEPNETNQRQPISRIENDEGLGRIEESRSRSYEENWDERREEMSVGDSRENPLKSDQGSLREKERDSVWKDEKIDPEKGENAIKQHSWQTSEDLPSAEVKQALWRAELEKQVAEKRIRDEKRREQERLKDQRLELKFKKDQEQARREDEEANQRRPKGIRLLIKDESLNKPKEAKKAFEEITRIPKKTWRNSYSKAKAREAKREKRSESLDDEPESCGTESTEHKEEVEEPSFSAYPIKSSTSVSSESLIIKKENLNTETVGSGDGPKTKLENNLEAIHVIGRALDLEGKRMEKRLGKKLIVENGVAEWKS